MSDLTFYDAAWPPDPAPSTDGVCIYIGGDTVHVWTPEEIGMQPARYRLPIFVRSNPRGLAGVAADVNACLAGLKAIGAPRGILVAFDLETAADKTYIAGVYAGLAAAGYELIVYGSQSDVMGNDNPDGLYFGADWTDHSHLARGDAMTQWVSFSGYDLDVAESSLPFWDTQAKAPKPSVKPAAPDVREWTTAGAESIAELAAQEHTAPSTILRMTAERGPSAEFSPEVAAYLNAVFAGHVSAAEKMPAGLKLYLPQP